MPLDTKTLERLGYKDISKDKTEELIAQLYVVLNQRFAQRLATELSAEDYEEYDAIENKPDSEKDKWLLSKISMEQQEKLIEEEIENMVQDLLKQRESATGAYKKFYEEEQKNNIPDQTEASS